MATISEALTVALQHHHAGQLREAEHIYRQIVQADPQHADAWHYLGVLYLGSGRIDEAVNCLHLGVSARPDDAHAHSDLGIALFQQGRLEEAAYSFRRAVQADPNFAEGFNNLGVILVRLGRLDEAVASHRQAIHLKPDYVEGHNNLGLALVEQGKPAEAVPCYQEALRLKPDYADACANLGAAYRLQGKLEEVVASCQLALRINPNQASAHHELGMTYTELDRLDEAVASYQEAVRLKPDYLEAYNNLGAVLSGMRRLEESYECYQRAFRLNPHNVDAHCNFALLLLIQGNLQQGLAEYEWRWRKKEVTVFQFQQPLWDGSPLNGRTILLHFEQGLGDSLQFIRYAALVKARGARVVVGCSETLRPLLATCPGVDQAVSSTDGVHFDVHIALLSLPRIFGTTVETIPADVPYLFPDPALVERWRRRLSEVHGLKIGIAWQGNPRNVSDRHRSMPLACLAPLARIPEIRLFSLQKGQGIEQLAQVGDRPSIIELGSRFETMMDTAAAMKNLDLVISVDSSVAHCAGAIGMKVWVPLAWAADWRWLLDREDSPWYPTMRLFRQKRRHDWGEVVERMVEEVRNELR